jgi:hypothetical protein
MKKIPTCDLLWKYGVEDLPFFDLLLFPHLNKTALAAARSVKW